MQKNLKVLFLGESGVGKTSLIFKLISGVVPEEWRLLAGFSEIPHYDITLHSVNYQLWIYDSWKIDELDRRAILYADTDVFVLCFDISNRYSFESLSTVLIPELRDLMPNIPILLVGNKADVRSSALNSDHSSLVEFEEPYLLARRIGGYYVECSAISCGLSTVQVMDACIHLWRAYNNTVTLITPQGKLRFLSQKLASHKTYQHPKAYLPLPPYLTLPGPLPIIQVPESTFTTDLLRSLEGQVCTDIQFVFVEDELPIEAHKMLLISASYTFEHLLIADENSDGCTSDGWYCEDKGVLFFDVIKCSCGKITVENKSKVCTCKTRVQTTLCREACSFLLKVLYLSGSDKLLENASENDKMAIEEFLKRFMIRNNTSHENTATGIPELRSLASKIKKLFLNKPRLSDVIFYVEGQLVFAHKVILTARSEVMARMLTGDFIESFSTQVTIEDTSLPCFLAMLEYLYTDTLPDDVTEHVVELMVLADRFALPRLVALCEQLIASNAGDCLGSHHFIQTGSDAAYLLNIAKACNADQLSNWCLQFIATNYSVIGDDDWALLDRESREYIKEHRWPSSSYFEELELFQKKTNRLSRCAMIGETGAKFKQ